MPVSPATTKGGVTGVSVDWEKKERKRERERLAKPYLPTAGLCVLFCPHCFLPLLPLVVVWWSQDSGKKSASPVRWWWWSSLKTKTKTSTLSAVIRLHVLVPLARIHQRAPATATAALTTEEKKDCLSGKKALCINSGGGHFFLVVVNELFCIASSSFSSALSARTATVHPKLSTQLELHHHHHHHHLLPRHFTRHQLHHQCLIVAFR